jgi:hypothetical protein
MDPTTIVSGAGVTVIAPSTASLELVASLVIGPFVWGLIEIVKRKVDLTPALTQAFAIVLAGTCVWAAGKMFAPGLGYEDMLQTALGSLGVAGIAVAGQKHVQEKRAGLVPPTT